MSAPFALPALPYADDALAPVISANTISFHYGKHHKAYVDNLNKLVDGNELASLSLVDIVKKTAGQTDKAGYFQQRRAGLEPYLLLGKHETQWRRQANRQNRRTDRPRSGRL